MDRYPIKNLVSRRQWLVGGEHVLIFLAQGEDAYDNGYDDSQEADANAYTAQDTNVRSHTKPI
jgi:hypothetical protein